MQLFELWAELAAFSHNTIFTWKWKLLVQSCPTLCNPMDYTAHGILQARIQEWVAFPFSRGSSQPRDRTQVFRIVGRFFTTEPCGKLWPWTKHFVLLSFSSLTKTVGIILRYKWKGLEQHVIQRSLWINPNYPPSPSFHLLYLAPWNTLFEDGDLSPLFIFLVQTLGIGIWFQVEKLESKAQPTQGSGCPSEIYPSQGWTLSDWPCGECGGSVG